MSGQLLEIPQAVLGNEAIECAMGSQLGRITVLEALAKETPAISPDGMGRCTMQVDVDFDD